MAPEPQGLKLRPAAGRGEASSVWLRSLRPAAAGRRRATSCRPAFPVKSDFGPHAKRPPAGGSSPAATPCLAVFAVWPIFGFYEKTPSAGGSGPAAGGRRPGRRRPGRGGEGRAGSDRGGAPRPTAGWPATACRAVFGVKRCAPQGEAKSGRRGVTGGRQGAPAGGCLQGAGYQILPNLAPERGRPGRPPGGPLPPAGPCSALKGVRGAKSGRPGVAKVGANNLPQKRAAGGGGVQGGGPD